MPKIVRVKTYFVFCDLKTFYRSKDYFLGELRRFSLSVEDNEDGSSSALYDQLVQKIHTTFGTDLMPKCQPFRLYWKDKEGHSIGFYSSSELLEAIDVMKPSDYEVTTTAPANLADALSKLKFHPDSLQIFVCVPVKVAAGITNECDRVKQAPPHRVPPTKTCDLLSTSSATTSATVTAATSKAASAGNATQASNQKVPFTRLCSLLRTYYSPATTAATSQAAIAASAAAFNASLLLSTQTFSINENIPSFYFTINNH